jgi:putative effector of murein hydrolase
MDLLINILVWAVIVFVIAYFAHWIITTYFPEPLRTPLLVVMGLILLLLLIGAITGRLPPIYGGGVLGHR